MTNPLDRLREAETPVFRAVIQAAIIIGLIVCAFSVGDLRNAATEDRATSTAMGGILATTCGAASFQELREQGLIEECRLAQEGELPDAIPQDELPDPDADVDDVEPDVIADDTNAVPADIDPPDGPGPSNAQVQAVVADYFRSNPLPNTPAYQRAIGRAVTTYLTEHPPEPGRPPTEGEVTEAVQIALLANPPADGVAGADGRSVAAASLDGCDVVFTYSDGSTDRVGPLCGPPPTDTQVANAVAAYCNANGECRGPQGPVGPAGVVRTEDNCQPDDGQFVTDVSISYAPEAQTVTISCATSSVLGGP